MWFSFKTALYLLQLKFYRKQFDVLHQNNRFKVMVKLMVVADTASSVALHHLSSLRLPLW